MRHVQLILGRLAFLGATGLLWGAPLGADEDLAVRSSWEEPDIAELCARVDAWIDQMEVTAAQRRSIDAARDEALAAANAGQGFESLISMMAIADADAADLLSLCRTGSGVSAEPFDDLASRCDWPPVVVANLRLLLGKTLAMDQLYNEALEQLSQLDVEEVSDPASLLFYLGATQYRLRQRDDALTTLGKLLERDNAIAARYATIARLMEAELKALEPDSLSEIAQIMDSIRIRLGHGRAGKRVRDEEQEVIDKLDKMIEQLESQLQQMQAQAMGQSGGGANPSTPMQDSMPAGGTGPGDVDPKPLGKKTDWGNLPPKEREAALQQLGDEFPSHYRSVIEEYFRQLAKEGEN